MSIPVLVIDDDTTRAEIVEALGHVNREAKRTPSHWPRKAALHDFINTLLDRWEAAGA